MASDDLSEVFFVAEFTAASAIAPCFQSGE